MLAKITLNGTDLEVSQFCYGTNMLGSALDQARSSAVLDRFAELGGNFIDTARMYGDWIPDGPIGASERAVGAWLQSRNRAEIVVMTKGCGMDLRKGDWQPRATPEDLATDLSQSLDHLGIDTVDLYLLHADNPAAPVEPIIDALARHQQEGRIRHYGASNWSAERIATANAYAKSAGVPGFVASETFWGLAVPEAGAAAQQGYVHYYEGEYEQLHAQGLPILAYGAQSGGYFTKRAEGRDLGDALSARYANAVNDGRLDAAREVADKHGVSINEVVLAYLASQPNQTIPIFGASSPEQLADSIRAAKLTLDAGELAQLRGH
jgi:aryl-alcohol dehydrogenase-like predicted oxidoreductase